MRTYEQWQESQDYETTPSFDVFLKARKDGAAQIAKKAKAKGGAAQLTAWHFAAKDPVYDQLIKKMNKDEIRKEFSGLLGTLSLENLTQKQFQEIMGKMEVLGEVFIRMKMYS